MEGSQGCFGVLGVLWEFPGCFRGLMEGPRGTTGMLGVLWWAQRCYGAPKSAVEVPGVL